MYTSFAIGGSRALKNTAPVRAFVRAALASGASLSVGCATGADAQVAPAIQRAQLHRLHIFAAFAPDGAGSWRSSAVSITQQAAQLGASVTWLAGGGLSVPLAARLMQRSQACCNSVVHGGACVFFLQSPSSPGSLAVEGYAVSRGLPVFAFSVGFAGAPAAPRGCAGAWVPASLLGFACWRWSPAQQVLL